jgi:hypothetical protein
MKKVSKFTTVMLLFWTILVGLCLLVTTSEQWLQYFWTSPFQTTQTNRFQFPPNIKLRLGINSGFKVPYKFAYIYTDKDGALISNQESDAKTIVLGSIMVSNIYLSPERRWTSKVKIPIRNFGYPGIYEVPIKNIVQKIIKEKRFDVTTFIFMTNNSDWQRPLYNAKGQILGNASDHTIFSEPISKHILLEFLYFNLSQLLEFRYDSLPVRSNQPVYRDPIDASSFNELLKLTDLLTIPKRRQELLEVINMITESGGKVVILTEPFPIDFNNGLPEFEQSLSFQGKKISWDKYYQIKKKVNLDNNFFKTFKNVQVVDIANCVETQSNEKTFWPISELSEEGNILFKECFDKLFSPI